MTSRRMSPSGCLIGCLLIALVSVSSCIALGITCTAWYQSQPP